MEPLNIAVLGATSKTGQSFIEQMAAKEEVNVFAFVRNVQKLKKSLGSIPKNLQIVPFDVMGNQSWAIQLSKCDVWVSIVGISGLWSARNPNQLYEKTAGLLTTMARRFNPKRVIVVTSGGVIESETEPWILKSVLKPYFLNPMYDDMRMMERMIGQSSMNFTVVRPPYLTNGPLKGVYRVIVDDWFKDDKVLSRKDLAHFLVAQSTELSDAYNRRFVGVSY